MHEASITSSIVDILKNIIKEKEINKILKVHFLLSPYGGIDSDSIKFYYEFLTKDDLVLKDAKLIFKKDKIKIACKSCGESFESLKLISRCKKCKGSSLSVVLPDDIKIKSIEI